MRRITSSVVLAALLAVGGSIAGLGAAQAGAGVPAPPVPVTPSTWTLGSVPSPTATNDVELFAVTCASSARWATRPLAVAPTP